MLIARGPGSISQHQTGNEGLNPGLVGVGRGGGLSLASPRSGGVWGGKRQPVAQTSPAAPPPAQGVRDACECGVG